MSLVELAFENWKTIPQCRPKQNMHTRVLQPPHKFENFIVATSTLAQVGGLAQKPFWSSFVKICQCLGVAQWQQNFGDFKKICFFHFKCFWSISRTYDPLWSFLLFLGVAASYIANKRTSLIKSYQKLHYRPTATSIVNTNYGIFF